MPNLICVNDFRVERNATSSKLNPCLYFTDAYANGSNNFKFVVAQEYLYRATIHIDQLEDPSKQSSRAFWISFRKWVERTCNGDVMYDYHNLDYQWWWNRDAKSEYQKEYSQVKHGYWYFHFEFESDLTMFSLMHGDKLSKPQQYHPDFGKDVIEQDKIYDKVT